MTVNIGADHVICALGSGSVDVFSAMQRGECGLRPLRVEWSDQDIAIGEIQDGQFKAKPSHEKLRFAIATCVSRSVEQLKVNVLQDPRCRVLLSTTKGEVQFTEQGKAEAAELHHLAKWLQITYSLPQLPVVVSNACASGTMAILFAADMIQRGSIDHALVIGVDMISDFVLAGFSSLFALSSGPCKPFDDRRSGISLGEACASIMLSKNSELFRVQGEVLGGGIANDANHISGPSRTGEGLKRAVDLALKQADISVDRIDHINAHGTGSSYNDTMEAIAFGRCGAQGTPVNSYKGYFGHTLGAAGVIETIIALRSMNEGTLLRSLGAEHTNELPPTNVLLNNTPTKGRIILKTSSGFGGINAAVMIKAKGI